MSENTWSYREPRIWRNSTCWSFDTSKAKHEFSTHTLTLWFFNLRIWSVANRTVASSYREDSTAAAQAVETPGASQRMLCRRHGSEGFAGRGVFQARRKFCTVFLLVPYFSHYHTTNYSNS